MKILCATDFTRRSDEATLAAQALAQQTSASLELVHVHETLSHWLHSSDHAALAQTLARGAAARLAERAQALTLDGLPTSWKLLAPTSGQTLAETLVQRAAELPADLVVISTHGHSNSFHWPMGSLAAAIAAAMPVPVLVIHSAKPFLHWHQSPPEPLNIFAALDLSEDSDLVLETLKHFALDRHSHLAVGFAQQLQPLVEDPLGSGSALAGSYSIDQAELQAKLQALFAKHFPQTQPDVRVQTGFSHPAVHLVEMAAAAQADLVALGTHQRHGLPRLLLGSVSQAVLHRSQANVLCIPIPHPQPATPPPSGPQILCATDFLPPSNQAALAAQALALRLGAPLELAHVVQDYLTWPGLPQETQKSLRTGAAARLQEFSLPLAKRGSCPHQSVLQALPHQSVAACLLQHLDTSRPRLAVISSHAKSGASWWPLGGTASSIAQSAPTPVLVVKSADPFLRWLDSNQKLHILGAIDANGDPPEVLHWMRQLGDLGPCTFTLAHIAQTYPISSLPLANPPDSTPPDSLALLQDRLQTIARHSLGENADFTLLIKETWEGIADELADLAQHSPTDLIVVGTRHENGLRRWLFESVARGLIHRSQASLLSLPTAP